MDIVSRELVGAIPAVTRDMSAETAAIGEEIKFLITSSAGTQDVVAGMDVTEGSGETLGKRVLKITKAKKADPIVWTGNEQVMVRGILNQVLVDQTSQRIRALVNEIETDLCNEIAASAIGIGNTVGTAGTEPFTTDLKLLTAGLKKLKDKGAPTGDLQAVLNTTAGMNLRNLSQLQKVNESDDRSLLRQGLLGNLMGFGIRESAGYSEHTAGTAAGYLVNGGAKAGETEVTIDTGSGTFKKGDFVKFGSSTKVYVIKDDVASGGTVLKLVSPLQEDVADNSAVTNNGNYFVSGEFDRSSVWLATRNIPVPEGGDKAIDRYVVTDPISGLSMTAALYPGYYQNQIEISVAWGVGVIKPEHTIAIVG